MDETLARARSFILTHARLLERRLYGVHFEGDPPDSIGRIIRAYQNPDGGLGHALEADIRCQESQPIFVGVAILSQKGENIPVEPASHHGYISRVAGGYSLVLTGLLLAVKHFLGFAIYSAKLFQIHHSRHQCRGVGLHNGLLSYIIGAVIGIVIESWAQGPIATNMGGEQGMTIVPNLLITGILCILVSLAVVVWAAALVQRRKGGLVLCLLSLAMLLVGGGHNRA